MCEERITTLDELIDLILFGDVQEIPFSILDDKIDAYEVVASNQDNTEIWIRLSIATCVMAFRDGRLSKSGHLLDKIEEKGNRNEKHG